MEIAYNLNGEIINHLIFMDDVKLFTSSERGLESFIHTMRVVSTDIGMQFGTSNSAMLVMWRGKVTKTEGIRITDDREIKNLEKGKSYKYLGVQERDEMWCREMTCNVTKEYFRTIRKRLKSKLNGENVICAVNTWAVSLVRYTAALIDWSNKELKNLDRKSSMPSTLAIVSQGSTYQEIAVAGAL